MIIVALFMVIMLAMLTMLNMLTMQFFMVIMVSDEADSQLGQSESLPSKLPLTSHICTFSWKYL